MNPYQLKILLGAVALVGAVGAASSFSGCSSSSQRLSEAEAINHKRALITEHRAELSPQHQQLIRLHPARTRGELDEAVEEFRGQFRVEQIEPGWNLRYTWQGEDRQSRFRNREGADRLRLSDLIPLPSADADASPNDSSPSDGTGFGSGGVRLAEAGGHCGDYCSRNVPGKGSGVKRHGQDENFRDDGDTRAGRER